MKGAITPTLANALFTHRVQTSLMLKTADGIYLNLHEAALINFPACTSTSTTRTLSSTSGLTPDARGRQGEYPGARLSPWRTIIASDDARDIFASKMTYNLNEPCKLLRNVLDKPTKYIGVWWQMISGKSTWAYYGRFSPRFILGRTDYKTAKT